MSNGSDFKLLGTTGLRRGIGLQQAEAIKELLDEWNLTDSCVAMCFDTTATNTGRLSGACILLEAILNRSLLWIACHHHMLEVVLSQVFKSIFGDSVGPSVELFQQLKNQWQSVDFTQSTHHMNQSTTACLQDVKHAYQSLVKIKSDPSYLPRDDYKKLLNLATYYIDEKSFSNFSFRRPGAQHRARWMSSCIYSLKMLLLQGQLQVEETDLEKLQSFGRFCCYILFVFLVSDSFSIRGSIQ